MEECYYTKSNAPPWVIFTFWKLQMVLNRAKHHILASCSFILFRKSKKGKYKILTL